jgi:calcineurin-like phosphoesterase family protein
MSTRQHLIISVVIALAVTVVLPALAQTQSANLPATVFPPYLQNSTADGMTICFLAQTAENVRVAWNADGETALTETAATPLVIPGSPWTMLKTRLTDLRPGGVYQYQVLFHLRFGGQNFVTSTHHFRTLNPQAQTLRFAVLNDIHQHDQTLAGLMRYVKPDDYEFSVLLGDCLEAYPNETELFRAWRAYLELLDAAEKPVIFVRGNHDTRQSFANRLAYLFDLPNLSVAQPWGEDQWQFALRAGPIWFLAMDTGEDENGVDTDLRTAYKQPEFWRAYRRREAEWLKKLLATNPGNHAPWHVFLSHIPLYNNNEWDSPSSREYWEPILRDANLDLMLAGHDHSWKLLPKKEDGRPPWPVLIGGGPSAKKDSEEATVMLITADTTTLLVRLLASSDGRELIRFKAEKAGVAKPGQLGK